MMMQLLTIPLDIRVANVSESDDDTLGITQPVGVVDKADGKGKIKLVGCSLRWTR